MEFDYQTKDILIFYTLQLRFPLKFKEKNIHLLFKSLSI